MKPILDFSGQILILSGPPGSGKTTTAAAISALPGSPKVQLHADDFWHFIKHGSIAPYLPEAHGQNQVVMEALAKVVQEFAKGGYFVVLDGIVGPWFLRTFSSITSPLHYVVLLPPVLTAIQRCKARGGNGLTDANPIADLHRQFSGLGSLTRHLIEISAETPNQVLQLVTEAVESQEFLLNPKDIGS